MTKETAQAVGDLVERLTRPIMTFMFGGAICWMGVRTVINISADQFVGIVMAVILFWFGSRPTASPLPPTATPNGGSNALAPSAPAPAPGSNP